MDSHRIGGVVGEVGYATRPAGDVQGNTVAPGESSRRAQLGGYGGRAGAFRRNKNGDYDIVGFGSISGNCVVVVERNNRAGLAVGGQIKSRIGRRDGLGSGVVVNGYGCRTGRPGRNRRPLIRTY